MTQELEEDKKVKKVVMNPLDAKSMDVSQDLSLDVSQEAVQKKMAKGPDKKNKNKKKKKKKKSKEDEGVAVFSNPLAADDSDDME